jgi:hypothetical protein
MSRSIWLVERVNKSSGAVFMADENWGRPIPGWLGTPSHLPSSFQCSSLAASCRESHSILQPMMECLWIHPGHRIFSTFHQILVHGYATIRCSVSFQDSTHRKTSLQKYQSNENIMKNPCPLMAGIRSPSQWLKLDCELMPTPVALDPVDDGRPSIGQVQASHIPIIPILLVILTIERLFRVLDSRDST